jgi:tetratricopeptide (TPR) repeat protein
MARTDVVAAVLIALVVAAPASEAQRGKKESAEFTKQGLLIVNFTPGRGSDMRSARRAADAVRSRLGQLANNREVDVIDGDDIRLKAERAGYSADTTFDLGTIHALGRQLRADEYVLADVTNGPSGPHIAGQLVLIRDENLRQPILEASAPKLDSAAHLFAKHIAAARAQLIPERRCENALRDGSGDRAVAAAKEGVASYPQGIIARACLLWALRATHAGANEILTIAREILAVDAVSPHALEAGAMALDSLHRRDEAADMWFKLAALDTANVDVAVRVAYSLLNGGNGKRAEPFIVRLADGHPEDIRPLQQKWRVMYENKNWTQAISAGESLLERDSLARRDSTFFLKLGTVYHTVNMPFKALETLAHGVSAFPKDTRLYSLYAQYIRAEADSVIPRGLALFPRSADLLAMNAKDLRGKGKLSESLDATKQAIAIDSTMAQGQLMVAQLEIELGRPDSALSSLHRAAAGGEDSTLVAQFALSKGNGFYRAANATKTSADFGLALRFLTFADSVRSTVQSKFLIGAAAFGVAQSAFTEGAAVKDKTESCRLARLGASMLPMARAGLEAGQEAFAEAAKQSLDFLVQLDAYSEQAVANFCK